MSVWRRAPLWLRLVASLVGLAALALMVSGLAGAQLLRGYLLDRLDAQLRSAAFSLAAGPISEEEAVAQLPSPFHITVYDTSGQRAGVWFTPLDEGHAEPAVPDTLTPSQAQARAGRPFTLHGGQGSGPWRAVALPIDGPNGTIGTVLVATNLHEVDATVDRLQHISMLVGLAVLAGLAIAGYAIVRAALRPLTEIERTAAAITEGDLTPRVPSVDPATEVGRVGTAINTMLDQIEAAFEAREASEATALRSEARMRQFIADASHELRTPLTSIRGFAELYRQPSMADDREAIADALRRIEDEAKRMGLLVDDLLLLARLDQQRPFATDPVDLVTVASDAASAARVVAQDRTITFTGPGGSSSDAAAAAADGAGADDGAGVAIVSGDDVRLRQLATNLVENAVRHTPAGTPIAVSVAVVAADDREWAELSVADHGPGLTAEQATRVFERFYRTDTARSRMGPSGAGLGLSIVMAIAVAHGGMAWVDTAPGEGATFRVRLPLLVASADDGAAPPSPDEAPDETPTEAPDRTPLTA